MSAFIQKALQHAKVQTVFFYPNNRGEWLQMRDMFQFSVHKCLADHKKTLFCFSMTSWQAYDFRRETTYFNKQNEEKGQIQHAFHEKSQCVRLLWSGVSTAGYGTHGTCHGHHFYGCTKISYQKLKYLFTVSWTSTLRPRHPLTAMQHQHCDTVIQY